MYQRAFGGHRDHSIFIDDDLKKASIGNNNEDSATDTVKAKRTRKQWMIFWGCINGLVLLLFLIGVFIRLLTYRPPKFEISSLSSSSIVISRSQPLSNITADWNLTFSVKNTEELSGILIDKFYLQIFPASEDPSGLNQTSTHKTYVNTDPFRLYPNLKHELEVKFNGKVPMLVSDRVAEYIERVMEEQAKMVMGLVFEARMEIPKLGQQIYVSTLRVVCSKVKVKFSASSATLADGGDDSHCSIKMEPGWGVPLQ